MLETAPAAKSGKQAVAVDEGTAPEKLQTAPAAESSTPAAKHATQMQNMHASKRA